MFGLLLLLALVAATFIVASFKGAQLDGEKRGWIEYEMMFVQFVLLPERRGRGLFCVPFWDRLQSALFHEEVVKVSLKCRYLYRFVRSHLATWKFFIVFLLFFRTFPEFRENDAVCVCESLCAKKSRGKICKGNK